MTSQEHLQKIKAKCERLVESEPEQILAEAGWRTTIVAIDEALQFPNWGGQMASNIISAWPEEIL